MQEKPGRIDFRIEPCLKRTFIAAARFEHRSLSQFLVQAGIEAVERDRRASDGLKIKAPAAPRDGRRRRQAAA